MLHTLWGRQQQGVRSWSCLFGFPGELWTSGHACAWGLGPPRRRALRARDWRAWPRWERGQLVSTFEALDGPRAKMQDGRVCRRPRSRGPRAQHEA